jgi:regulator of protease activity HflC (stomatin/prohibitin superfamily)
MKQQNGFIDPTIALVVVGAVVVIGGLAFALPQYNVWTKTLNGKALLQEAEYTRQVAVLEAQAKKDSAQQLADAEIIRARGVAQANQIIGDSLKGNPAYLQYLWITQGEENTNRTVYMVPSNGGAPVPTFDIQSPPAKK